MKRVTQFIANVMAKTVLEELTKSNESAKSNHIKSAESSRSWKKLVQLQERKSAIEKEFSELTKSIQANHPVQVNTYPKLKLTANNKGIPKYEDIRNRIIVASHVDNVPAENLIKTVTAEFKKSTGLA